jgi:hypothetical protein
VLPLLLGLEFSPGASVFWCCLFFSLSKFLGWVYIIVWWFLGLVGEWMRQNLVYISVIALLYLFSQKSKINTLNEVYRKLIHPGINNLPSSDSEGLQRICRTEKYSYVISQTTLRGLARSIPCNIVGVSQAYYTITASMIISKSSPYRRILNYQ